MLVLSRKTGESIMIGDDIRISVLDVKVKTVVNAEPGKRREALVKLGIEAPRAVQVYRSEVYHPTQAKKTQNAKEEV